MDSPSGALVLAASHTKISICIIQDLHSSALPSAPFGNQNYIGLSISAYSMYHALTRRVTLHFIPSYTTYVPQVIILFYHSSLGSFYGSVQKIERSLRIC